MTSIILINAIFMVHDIILPGLPSSFGGALMSEGYLRTIMVVRLLSRAVDAELSNSIAIADPRRPIHIAIAQGQALIYTFYINLKDAKIEKA